MQDTLTVWNSKQAKVFYDLVHEQWGTKWKPDAALLQNSKGKVFLVTRDIANIDWSNLRISSAGMYIAEMRRDHVRLSIEGSQLIGPTATKNIVDIRKEQVMDWLKGHDLEVDEQFSGFVIVRCGKDYMGTGHFKEGVLANYVPKARRLPESA